MLLLNAIGAHVLCCVVRLFEINCVFTLHIYISIYVYATKLQLVALDKLFYF